MSSGLFKRPDGDEVAAIYGHYFTRKEISHIKVGDKLGSLLD